MVKPIKFKGCNVIYAKDQPEYLPLPVLKTEEGRIVTCWYLTWRERLTLCFCGRIWLSLLTFNKPLQPLLLSTNQPNETKRPDCLQSESCAYLTKWGKCYPAKVGLFKKRKECDDFIQKKNAEKEPTDEG